MKLYYFKDPKKNFGDDLNPWLWHRLVPHLHDDDSSQLFVGIGTLINHRVPAQPIKHVFGSGVGYGDVPALDDKWKFHVLRGYESARLLNADHASVITDGAVLLNAVDLPRAPSTDKAVGFIPHCLSNRYYGWGRVAEALGMHFIDVRWDVERVLVEMTRCRTLVCEAMHGAIVADTLRIPWIPVSCYDYISAFKWRDWLSTVSLPYDPVHVTSLYDIERDDDWRSRAKNSVKRGLQSVGVWSDGWTPPPAAKTGQREFDRALGELSEAMKREPMLSADSVLDTHTHRFLERLHAFAAHAPKSPI